MAIFSRGRGRWELPRGVQRVLVFGGLGVVGVVVSWVIFVRDWAGLDAGAVAGPRVGLGTVGGGCWTAEVNVLCEFAVNVDAAGFKEDVVLRLLWTLEAVSFDRKLYRCVEGDSVLAGPVVRGPEVTW